MARLGSGQDANGLDDSMAASAGLSGGPPSSGVGAVFCGVDSQRGIRQKAARDVVRWSLISWPYRFGWLPYLNPRAENSRGSPEDFPMKRLNSCSSRWLSCTKLLRSASSSCVDGGPLPAPATVLLLDDSPPAPFSVLTAAAADGSDAGGDGLTVIGGGGGGKLLGEVDDESDATRWIGGGFGSRIPFNSAAYGDVDADAERGWDWRPFPFPFAFPFRFGFGLVCENGGGIDDDSWPGR